MCSSDLFIFLEITIKFMFRVFEYIGLICTSHIYGNKIQIVSLGTCYKVELRLIYIAGFSPDNTVICVIFIFNHSVIVPKFPFFRFIGFRDDIGDGAIYFDKFRVLNTIVHYFCQVRKCCIVIFSKKPVRVFKVRVI